MCLYLLPQILLPSQGQNTPGKKKTPFIPKKSSYQIFSSGSKKVLLVDNSCFLRNGGFPKGMSTLRILWCYGKNHPHPSLFCLLTFQQPLLPREIAPGWKTRQRKGQRFHSTSFPGIYWGDPSIKEGEHPNLSSVVVMKENELPWAAEGWVIPCSL